LARIRTLRKNIQKQSVIVGFLAQNFQKHCDIFTALQQDKSIGKGTLMSNIFMYADGIKGDCSDKHHKDWIELVKVGWGVGRDITSKPSTRGDRESSNAQTADLQILKLMDRATPQTFIESCCGRARQVIIELTKTGSGKGADVYMQYIFHHALFSNYHVRHRKNNKRRPMEFLTLSYTKVEQRYIQYDENNTPLAPVAVGFNTATNSKV